MVTLWTNWHKFSLFLTMSLLFFLSEGCAGNNRSVTLDSSLSTMVKLRHVSALSQYRSFRYTYSYSRLQKS